MPSQCVILRRDVLAAISSTAVPWMAVESAHALSKEEIKERRALVESQKLQLEYLLEQQRTASRAKAAEREQEVGLLVCDYAVGFFCTHL